MRISANFGPAYDTEFSGSPNYTMRQCVQKKNSPNFKEVLLFLYVHVLYTAQDNSSKKRKVGGNNGGP